MSANRNLEEAIQRSMNERKESLDNYPEVEQDQLDREGQNLQSEGDSGSLPMLSQP